MESGKRIPTDVMAAAMRALMVPEPQMVDSVARALLAERERAAKIAEGHEASIGYMNTSEYAAGERRACEAIAEAIRS